MHKTPTTPVHWICRTVKQFGCNATIITSRQNIIEFPKRHCCRYVPGETEDRKKSGRHEGEVALNRRYSLDNDKLTERL